MPRALLRIPQEQRRARLARRHHLASRAKAASPVEVARDLVGLHGTTASSVFIAAAARLLQPSVKAIEEALYEDRTLIRMLGMRRTMFVVPAELAPVIQAACTRAIAVRERKRLLRLLEEAGVAADAAAWLAPVERATLRALEKHGEATAAQLGADVPGLRTQMHLSEGKAYAGTVSVGTRLLFVLAAEGRVVRLRPLGSWAGSQFRWAPIDAAAKREWDSWSVEPARAELLRRYLRAFGPATMSDLCWWTGLSGREVNRALAGVDTVSVVLDGGEGLLLADDEDTVGGGAPWAALLPALDPTVMGWEGRDWYLGPHRPALFDRSGNAGPTVWWEGRVVGGWAQRGDGQIVHRLLEDIGREGKRAVETAAARLQSFIGPVRFTPGFRTPLEKQLSSQ